MGETIEFTCECGTEDRIDSSSLDFITSITGWDREDAKLCDGCLSEELAGTTLDMSIGGGHTRSEEFEEQRRQRKRSRKQDEIDAAKQRAVIVLDRTFVDEDRDVERVALEMPAEAKHDLKDLQTSLVHPEYDRSEQAWAIDASAVDRTVDHLRDQGWTVEINVSAG